jgi:AmmeMemoRadiSam system protein B
VGNLSRKKLEIYGSIFAKYLADPSALLVISSDFCHWGSRFSYTHTLGNDIPIYQSIENLDKQGMSLIEGLDGEGFAAYLQHTENTICGRHPIRLLLQACRQLIDQKSASIVCRFTHYAQSSEVRTIRDSSVSYASAYFTVELSGSSV